MDEASLCDRIAFIQNGNTMQIDTPENIINRYGEILWAVRSENMHKLLFGLRANEYVKTCFTFG